MTMAGSTQTLATPGRRTGVVRLSELLFWACALILLFAALGDVGLIRSESRWAEIVREMVQHGSYFDPTLNGRTYFDKPLLSYWLAVAVHALGVPMNEWMVRLPSALAALVVLWSTLALGRLLWNRQLGLTAGWLLLLSYGLLGWGRLGEADMENLAVISLAVYWYWKHRDSTRFLHYLGFHALIFAGAHFKGLVAVVVPALIVLPDLMVEGRWRRHLNVRQFAALLVGVGIYFLPFLLIAVNSGDRLDTAIGLVVRENVQRFFKPFDHVDPVYAYLVHWPTLMLPWIPLMLVALFKLARRWKELAWRERWLLWALLLVFAFFTASGSRRLYYILPILPFTALAMALCLQREQKAVRPGWGIRLQAGLLALVILLEIASWFAWPWLQQKLGVALPPGLRTLGLWPGGLAALVWVIAWRTGSRLGHWLQVSGRLAVLLPPTVVLLGGYFLWQQPEIGKYRSARPMGLALRPLVRDLPAERIGLVVRGKPPMKVMFYSQMPFPARRLDDAREVRAFLQEPGFPKLLLVEKQQMSLLPDLLARQQPALAEAIHPWEKHTRDKLVAWIVRGPSSQSAEGEP